ncbi:Hsp20 family protein [Oleispirillum naphthae]|uniref:Hsp20 family protein n=1 Tax=Oleispirillum naphthae TaxID=2838853 RepID=UPI0030824E31
MRTYDLSPLHRFTVGFDNVSRLMDAVSRLDEGAMSYPPYNIERFGEDRYRISMAVAGFSEDDLDITAKDNSLTVTGRKAEETGEADGGTTFLHRGIAARAFERRFELAAHIKVTGASLENGLLHIDLEREVPEELKPRKIAISAEGGKTAIGGPKAA